jgi:PAS domain S-box-containing protein
VQHTDQKTEIQALAHFPFISMLLDVELNLALINPLHQERLLHCFDNAYQPGQAFETTHYRHKQEKFLLYPLFEEVLLGNQLTITVDYTDGEDLFHYKVSLAHFPWAGQDYISIYVQDVSAEGLALEHETNQNLLLNELFESSPEAQLIVEYDNPSVVKLNARAVSFMRALSRSIIVDAPNGKDDILHPDFWLDQQTTLVTKGRASKEIKYITANGSNHYARVIARHIQADGQHFRAIRVIDITEQVLTEINLKQRQEYLDVIFNNSDDALFVLDATDSTIADCNERALALFRLPTKSAFIGTMSNDLLEHPMDIDRVKHIIQELREKRSYSGESICKRADGTVFWVHLSLCPLDMLPGKPVLLQIQDINEQKLAENALRESELQLKDALFQYKMLLEASSDGIWEWDILTGNISFSKRWKSILGYEDSELMGHNFHQLGQLIAFESELIAQHSVSTNRDSRSVTVFQSTQQLRHKSGQLISAYSRTIHLMNGDGEIIRIIGLLTDITVLSEMEQRLTKSQQRMMALLQAIPDYMFRMTLSGDMLDYNSLMFELLQSKYIGCAHGHEAESKTWTIYSLQLGPALTDQFLNLARRVAETSEEGFLEFRLDDGGVPRYFEARTVPVSEQEVVIIMRDISERYQSALRLENAYAQLQAIFDYSPAGFQVVNHDGQMVQTNQTLQQLLGYTRDELERLLYTDLLLPDEVELWTTQFEQILSREVNNFSGQITYVAKDGRKIWVQYVISHMSHHINNQSYDFALIITNDLSQQRLIENQLEETNRQFKSVFNFAPIGIGLVTEEGYIIKANRALHSILNLDENALFERQFKELTFLKSFPDNQRDFDELVYYDWNNGYQLQKCYHGVNKMGLQTDVWLSINVRPMEGEMLNGQHIYLALVENITMRKNAEAELKKSKELAEAGSKAKSEFLAHLSHDIRNPIAGIVGSVRLLEKTSLTKMQGIYLKLVRICANRITNNINNTLDYSKIEANRYTLTIGGFDLKQIALQQAQLYSFLCPEKGLGFLYFIDDNLPKERLKGDSVALVRILDNLLNNALKFTQNGEVYFEAKMVERTAGSVKVCFIVKDSGIGIREEDFGRLFQPFGQVDSSSTKEVQGTGLGLLISKRLAELMGGELKFTSEYGIGTTFFLEVPFQVDEHSNSPEIMSQSNWPISLGLKSYHILLVEDDPIILEYIQALLLEQGAEVEIAFSGLEALNKVIEQEFDLILTDGAMPQMDGIQLAQHVRTLADPFKQAIPMIAMTGFALEEDRDRFLNAGFNDYITKPVDEEVLIHCIQQLLSSGANR